MTTSNHSRAYHGRSSGDNDSRAALTSLSEELDELSRTLDKNTTFQEFQQMRNKDAATNFQMGNSVDVSSLGSEVKSRSSTHNRPGMNGISTNHSTKSCSSAHKSPIRTTKQPMGGSSSCRGSRTSKNGSGSIANLERQSERLSHLLQRTRDDKSYTGEDISNQHSVVSPQPQQADGSSISGGASDKPLFNSERLHRHHQRRKQGQQESINTENASPMEPPPVQSPPFRFFSPAATATSSTANDNNYHDNLSSGMERMGGRNIFQSSTTENSEWQPALDNVKQIMQARDERIRYLEEENAFLRSLLQQLQNKFPTPLEDHSSDAENDPTRARTGREPNAAREFTDGTKFVAELAGLTDISVGNHAPISYIIDKHWDRIVSCNSQDNLD